MGKDVKKKFTVSLDIDTKDAEKQVKASAEHIKEILSGAIKDGVGVKELRNIADAINSIFEGIGQMPPLDIDKNFKGNGSAEKRIKMLTDALDNLGTVIDQIKTGSLDGIGGKTDGISQEVQEEINRLKKQKQEMQDIIDAINNPQAVNIKLSKKADDQFEQVKALKDAFDEAKNAKVQLENSNLKGTPEYLAAVGKYIKAAAQLKSGFENEALKGKSINWINAYGTDALNEAETALKKFSASSQQTMNEIQNIFSEKIGSINNEIEFLAQPYDTLNKKIQEYAILQDTINNNERLSDDESDKIYDQIDVLEKYFVSLDKVGNKKQEIKKILGDLTFGDINSKDALEEFSNLLEVQIPEAAQKAEDSLKSVNTVDANSIFDQVDETKTKLNEVEDESNKSAKEISSDLEQVENKTQNVTASFQELVNYISQSGTSPGTFFNKLEAGAQNLDDELKNILQSLSLIDSAGKINLESIKSGFTNKGGFVSDQYTMIARPDWYLPKIESLQPMLAEAQQAGAKIGAIVDIIEDKAHNLLYEVQNTVAGTAAYSIHDQSINKDALNATDEQIQDLVNTLQVLQSKGLFVDWGGDNVLYDKDKGFSIIDLGNKGGKHHTVSVQNTMQENLDRLAKNIFALDDGANKDLTSKFTDRLYTLAKNIAPEVYNPNSTVSTKQQVTNTNAVTSSVQKEESAHEQNAAAIEAENAAIQAQIKLKKKAQSMKWEAFALDESTVDLKKIAGFQTLSDMEKFWKSANYEKQINWHEISQSQAESIFKKKLPAGLTSEWYGAQKFKVKDKLENEILADDEIRNAALNYLYHIYNKQIGDKKNPNVNSFKDFLNTEFEVYRYDDAPLIYGDESKLSFSFHPSKVSNFDNEVGTAKIKPKDTIGNAGSTFESEIETFVDSSKTSWFKQTGETFAEFYGKQTKEMQSEIDAGLINLEKQRISDILGADFTKLMHQAGKTQVFQNGILKQFQQGIIPESFDITGYEDLNDAYNNLSNMGKKLAAYYASIDALSSSLPEQFSIVKFSKEASKDKVGENANLFNAVLNDPSGVKQHVASLTGELNYNLFDKSEQAIKSETEALKQHAQVVKEDAQAQQELNNSKNNNPISLNDVQDQLYNTILRSDYEDEKKAYLDELYDSIIDISNTPQAILDNNGEFINGETGEVLPIKEIFNLIDNIEMQYGENLGYIKDYLQQVCQKLNVDQYDLKLDDDLLTEDINFSDSFNDIYWKLEALNDGNAEKCDALNELQSKLSDISYDAQNNVDLISEGKFMDTSTWKATDWTEVSDLVSDFESQYGENLDYVHNYLKQVFAKQHEELNKLFDSSDSGFTFDGGGASGATYSVKDYEDAYKLQQSSVQEAIDDLALFYQKYQELQAKINQDPIDIMFSGIPTPDEKSQILSAFEEFKAKQKEVFNMSIFNVEDDKEKLQELQAEVVGLQNKLKGANLGKGATGKDYRNIYGLKTSLDGDRLKNLIDSPGAINSILNDLETELEQKQQQVYDKVSSNFADMITNDTSDSLEQYFIQHAKSLQNVSERQLQTEQEITAEKQKQVASESEITAEKQKQSVLGDVNDGSIGVSSNAAVTAVSSEQKLQASQDITAESAALDGLLTKLNEVRQAVEAKTQAFEEEYVTVDAAVAAEIDSLNKLKLLLDNIQNLLQISFISAGKSFGDINLSQDQSGTSNTVSGILQSIQGTLEQIYGVLTGFTGVESDNKNSLKYKEPVADTPAKTSDVYDALVNKLPSEIATEGTLSTIKDSVQQLVNLYKPKENDKSNEGSNIQETLSKLVTTLTASVKTLQDVASGIMDHQKAQQTDKSAAMAKIADPIQYKQVVDIATSPVGQLGSEVQVKGLQALANGAIKVEGAFKDANGAWQGFTVKVNEANQAVDLATDKQSSFAKSLNNTSDMLTQQNAKLNGVTKQANELYKSLKINPLDTSDSATAVKDVYSKLLETLDVYKKKKDALTDDELNGLQQIYAQLMKNAQAYAALHEGTNKKVQKAYGSNIMQNRIAQRNTLTTKVSADTALTGSSVMASAMKEYDDAWNRLNTLYAKLQNTPNPTEDDKIAFKEASAECNNLGKEVEKLLKSYAKMHNDSNVVGETPLENYANRAKELQDYVEATYGAKAVIGDFKNNYNELEFTIDNGNGTFTKAKVAVDNLRTSLVETAGDTQTVTSKWGQFVNDLKGKFRSISTYLISMTGFQEVWQQIRQGIQYVREIDSALTELKKVTDETDATYRNFLQTMSQSASVVGSTTSELTQSAADWARLGYSIEQAGELAKNTAILMNVSEFDNVNEATEALISSLQAFGYEASNSIEIVDKLNIVGNKFA